MSKLYGAEPRDEIDELPAGSILRRLAYALSMKLGEWISTEDLMDVAYDYEHGSKEALKQHIHLLRQRLPGYTIDGHLRKGRRLRQR